MKAIKFFVSALMVGALVGCANSATKKVEAFNAENYPKAESGEIKYSTYYEQAYQLASEIEGLAAQGVVMQGLAEMIKVSREYESGGLSYQEFKDKEREIQANVAAQEGAIIRQERAEYSAAFRQGMQNAIIQQQIQNSMTNGVITPQNNDMTCWPGPNGVYNCR
jgi:hypothetical protein